MTKKPAFTLIEVLITTSIMVVIAGLTVSIFTGIGNFQVNRRSAQALTTELRQFEEQVRLETANAANDAVFTALVRNLDNTPSQAGDLLAIRRTVTEAVGTAAYEWRFYCFNDQSNAFLRARVPLLTQTPEQSTLQNIPAECNGASLRNLVFEPGGGVGQAVVDTLVEGGTGTLDYLVFTPYVLQNAGASEAKVVRAEIKAVPQPESGTAYRFMIPLP